MIITILFLQKIVCIKFNLFSYRISQVILKIKGTGKKIILGEFFLLEECFPDEIRINGIISNEEIIEYDFDKEDNKVELIWNNHINSCSFMFADCIDITEIDLSNFNTSLVTSMSYMFSGCSSLTSLNLSNFDTSKVGTMSYMFKGCSSLTSLNISNFKTSKNTCVNGLFQGCINLEYINMYK